ncbi:MAG: T9SS type A sorting domain-containing protein [bacterium]
MKSLFLTLTVILLSFSVIFSETNNKEKIQRKATKVFDLQNNTKSNFQFPLTNYGILFLDVSQTRGGGFWPRGSQNQYIFSGGLWFGAKKFVLHDTGTIEHPTPFYHLDKLCEVTYNPNSGASWMVPGRIEDGDNIDLSDTSRYRTYFSTDMNSDGQPIDPIDGPNWTLWLTEEQTQRNLGSYIQDISLRNYTTYPMGPAYISDEDIFCTYKDTDLFFYEGGTAYRRNLGYPLGLQFEQTVFSWEDNEKKDMVIIYYKIKNSSQDTLFDCWIGPVYDTDLATLPNFIQGATNDLMRFYDEDESLNMGITWSLMDKSEVDMGYMSASMILTPSVYRCDRAYDTLVNGKHHVFCAMCIEKDTITIPDYENPGSTKDTSICVNELMFPREKSGFLRTDKKYYPVSQQLGMKTFLRWGILDDFVEDEARYNSLSLSKKDLDIGEPGDYRMMFSTGSFHLAPGETASCAVLINFAMPSLGADATGETDDLTDLVEKVKLGRSFFYNDMISKVQEREKQLGNSMLIYPNPASNKVFIKHGLTGDINISIYDILGINVMKNVILSSSKDVIELNTENLNTGTYIICLSDNNNVISEKFCVIR